jgi:hypothetical protein
MDLYSGLKPASINAFQIFQSVGTRTDTRKNFSGAGGRRSGQAASTVMCQQNMPT